MGVRPWTSQCGLRIPHPQTNTGSPGSRKVFPYMLGASDRAWSRCTSQYRCDGWPSAYPHTIASVGDLVFVGRDPLIHRQKGGTSLGLVNNLKALLHLDADQYVPGHGDIVSKREIETAMKGIEEKQARIRSLIQEGKTLDDVKKAFGVAEGPGAAGARRFMSLAEVIYLDLSEKR
jgi:hypothetical protein